MALNKSFAFNWTITKIIQLTLSFVTKPIHRYDYLCVLLLYGLLYLISIYLISSQRKRLSSYSNLFLSFSLKTWLFCLSISLRNDCNNTIHNVTTCVCMYITAFTFFTYTLLCQQDNNNYVVIIHKVMHYITIVFI